MTITTGCGAWPVIALPTTGLASHQLVAIMTLPHAEQRLVEYGIYLITKVRNRLLSYADKLLLRKRAIPRSASRPTCLVVLRNGSETR